MSYETVSVRMNRSDNSIRWGFVLSNSGNRIIIQTVEPGSLSEKAGLRSGDFVETIGGQNARIIRLQEANEMTNQARFEICFTLQRYVTSHSCLPWTLSEKDNKLVVDDIQPASGYTYSSSYPAKQHSVATLNTSKSNNFPQTVHSPNLNQFSRNELTKSSTPFGSCYNTSSYVSGTTLPTNSNNNNFSINRNTNCFNPNFPNRNSVKFTEDAIGKASYLKNDFAEAKNQSYDPPAPGITIKSSTLPLNQQTTILTSCPNNNAFRSGSRSQSSLSPGGSRLRFHSPSSRTRRDLSPNSSIEHLQYNSPMNLYSSDAVAEQYALQTGRSLEGQRSQNNTPAYLNSETKKYIEEVEGRMRRGLSPSCQSSSFKRISEAVGAPCNR